MSYQAGGNGHADGEAGATGFVLFLLIVAIIMTITLLVVPTMYDR